MNNNIGMTGYLPEFLVPDFFSSVRLNERDQVVSELHSLLSKDSKTEMRQSTQLSAILDLTFT